MTTERLVDLIDRICNEDDCCSKSISWQAYREAEKLSDTSLLPFLQKTITENKNSCKKRKKSEVQYILLLEKLLETHLMKMRVNFLLKD